MTLISLSYLRKSFCIICLTLHVLCFSVLKWEYLYVGSTLRRHTLEYEALNHTQSLRAHLPNVSDSVHWIPSDPPSITSVDGLVTVFSGHNQSSSFAFLSNVSDRAVNTGNFENISSASVWSINVTLLDQHVAVESPITSTNLLILVLSALRQTGLRSAIRNSWGEDANLRKFNASLRFVVGRTNNASRNNLLSDEMATYRDIVQVAVFDVYNNLSLKCLEAFRLAHEHFPHTKYVLKQDDDTYVNLTLLQNQLHSFELLNRTQFIAGYYFEHRTPKRNKKSRYYTPYSVWLNKTWPPAVTGPAYVFTSNIIPKLLKTAQNPDVHLVWWEDIYITAVLRHFANVPLYDIPNMRHVSCSRFAARRTSRVSYHRVREKQHAELYRNGTCRARMAHTSRKIHTPGASHTSSHTSHKSHKHSSFNRTLFFGNKSKIYQNHI